MSIKPTDMTIDKIFSGTKYYIDFYQREYKWQRDHIISLLDDVFYRFQLEYKPTTDPTEANIAKYEWYYLSSFMTNDYNGRTYIVDGQQRLTTLTLIIINLYHLSRKFGDSNISEVLQAKLYGPGMAGKTFWMGQNGRTIILERLFKDEPIELTEEGNISHINMVKNAQIIKEYLEREMFDDHIFKSFVFYFLTKVNLVNIHIEKQRDVAMVFEVINDRGEKLRPFEVFKGALLGILDKDEIDAQYNELWRKGIEPLEIIDPELPDTFFRDYFRSQYVEKRSEYRDFDGEYHKTVFSNKWDGTLQLKRNIPNIKGFIINDFSYYSRLYQKLSDPFIHEKDYGEYVFYNSLTNQDRQMLLILSACVLNDPLENEKIITVSRLLDRNFVLLQLYGCYDSNAFTDAIIELNSNIRGQDLPNIKKTFDNSLLNYINRCKDLEVTEPFQYTFFKDARNNMGITFVRYFFARIENYLNIKINGQRLDKLQFHNYVRNVGPVNGYHVEHILSNNEQNRALFNHDEEAFQLERNRLGALLLLKGKDNISSSNETYQNKLKTYSASNLWNRTLIEEFYHTNLDFRNLRNQENLGFKPYDIFDAKAVEERQQLLFQLAKIIWS